MLNNKTLEIQLKSEIIDRGCMDTEHINNEELLSGYIINKQGSKEIKIVAIAANEPSLIVNHKLINAAMKIPTIELGIIQTPNKIYYIDMSTGMPTDIPKNFINYSQHVTSEEDIKRKIALLIKSAKSKRDLKIIERTITPIAVRAYFSQYNEEDKWLNVVDVNKYNNMIDEIKNKFEISENILIKIEDADELENIKIALAMLDPISIYYAKTIEDLLRRNPLNKGLMISSQNMVNVVSEFTKTLDVNKSCIELGSGSASILRSQGCKVNVIKGIEIDKYLSDISKLLNLISGKENIEILSIDALEMSHDEKYGLTIVEPPLGARIDREKYKNSYLVARNSKKVDISDLLLEKAINITDDGGYIVAVINDRVLFTSQSEAIRKLIVSKTTIKAIVSLPNHIQKPYTVSEMSIVIMKKNTNDLEHSKSLFVNKINKIEEIDEVSNKFYDFIQNDLDDRSIINYDVLYESQNWTANYLQMYEELNSQNRYPLKELCEINNKGIRTLNNEAEKYPYIEVNNIDSEKKILKDIKEVKFSELSPRAKLLAYPGDIVISTVRPDKGAIAIVPNDNDVYIVSNALAVLSPKNISAELLYFILSSKKVTQDLSALASGTAVPMIMMKQLKEYKLPISDIPNQYEKEAKELYNKMMIKYTQHKTLNQIIDETLKYIDKANGKEYTINDVLSYKRPIILKDEREVKQVKISNLNSESLYVDEKELDVLDEKDGRNNLIMNKDVLIPRVLEAVDRTSVADANIEGCISNQVIYTFSANEIVLPEYMAMLFRSSEVKDKLEVILRDSKVRTMIKRDVIQAMNIKLPTLEIQQNVVGIVLDKTKKYSLNDMMLERNSFEDKLI